jgi:hypothetical protein
VFRENRELIVFGIFIVAAIAACFIFAYWQVDVSQHHWCNALNILTEHPVSAPADPSANPSRVQAYELSQEFIKLKGEFGCG